SSCPTRSRSRSAERRSSSSRSSGSSDSDGPAAARGEGPSMADPLERANEMSAAVELVAARAARYLEELDASPALPPAGEDAARSFGGALPEDGDGALAALAELLDRGVTAATRSSGPRFFHFVTG